MKKMAVFLGYIINNDLNFIPDINDAMHFSLKKTVGTLKINYCKNKKICQN